MLRAGRSGAGNHKTRWERRGRAGGGRPRHGEFGLLGGGIDDVSWGRRRPLDRDAHIHICGLRSLWAFAGRTKNSKSDPRGLSQPVGLSPRCVRCVRVCIIYQSRANTSQLTEVVSVLLGILHPHADEHHGTTTHEERIGLDSASTRDARRSETAPATRGGAARARESASHMHPERETACEGTTPW